MRTNVLLAPQRPRSPTQEEPNPPRGGFFYYTVTPKRKPLTDAEKKQRFLEGYKGIGTKSAGARAAGVTRWTVHRWLEKDAEFRQRFEEAEAEFKDHIEELMMERLERGENGATLRFKAQAEIPDKYRPPSQRPKPKAPKARDDADAKWRELEKRAEEDGGT